MLTLSPVAGRVLPVAFHFILKLGRVTREMLTLSPVALRIILKGCVMGPNTATTTTTPVLPHMRNRLRGAADSGTTINKTAITRRYR